MDSFMSRAAELIMENGSLKQLTVLNGSAENRDLTAQKLLLCNGKLLAQDESLMDFWEQVINQFSVSELPRVEQVGSASIFGEQLTAGERLIICGGGHVAAALSKIGAILDFELTIIDDRPEFANENRFPEAQQIICKPYSEALKEVEPSPNNYYVIVTRDPLYDRDCLETILNEPFAYAGMIGNRHKISMVMDALLEGGCTQAQLNRIHAPIGLDIGAQTPAEIAVCIAAEIIQTKQSTDANTCVPDAILNELAQAAQPLAMATIIDKQGSAPRSIGTKMLIRADGEQFGTIGGGCSEAQVGNAAAQVLASGKPVIQKFEVTKPGMACGGVITVFIEPVR